MMMIMIIIMIIIIIILRDRKQTDQAYTRSFKLSFMHGKMQHTLHMNCLARVSSVGALDT